MSHPVQTFLDDWRNSTVKEKAFMIAGGVFLAAAIVGMLLPLVPQVPFAILSAYLFSKGSPRLHAWIRNSKYLGPPVTDWEDHRVVRRNLKLVSTLAMLGGAAIGHWQLTSPWHWVLDGVLICAIVFVLTRREKVSKTPTK